jgi:hypothetical protein
MAAHPQTISYFTLASIYEVERDREDSLRIAAGGIKDLAYYQNV